ncbi:MAG: hypothetical protein ACP5XB_27335, partial [Isosphaeraceae bacterium]
LFGVLWPGQTPNTRLERNQMEMETERDPAATSRIIGSFATTSRLFLAGRAHGPGSPLDPDAPRRDLALLGTFRRWAGGPLGTSKKIQGMELPEPEPFG